MTLAELLATNGDWPGSLTDQEALDWLKANVDRNREFMSGNELFSLTDSTEFGALSDLKKDLWVSFTTRDGVDPFDPAAVAFVQYVFGAGTTVSTLAAARVESVPRWRQQDEITGDIDDASWLFHINAARP